MSLRQLAKNVEALGQQSSVKLGEVLSPKFISSCSRFSDLQALFEGSPFKIQTEADFAAIPDAEWDKYIAENSSYASWGEMQRAAHAEWISGKIRSGIS